MKKQMRCYMQAVKKYFLFTLCITVILCGVASYSAFASTSKHVDGVTEEEGNVFYDPKIKIVYHIDYGTYTKTDSKVLGISECTNIKAEMDFPVRVCARLANPGVAKYPGDDGYNEKDGPAQGDNAAYNNYGNNTALITDPNTGKVNPRVQICGYEDPCDAMDPPNGNCTGNGMRYSPHHHNEVNKNAISVKDAANMGREIGGAATSPAGAASLIMGKGGSSLLAIDGVSIPTSPYAVAGMVIASITAGIMQKYNHVVVKDLGCVEVPLGPLPPEYCHDCWVGTPYKFPRIEEDPNSTFESPKVKLFITDLNNNESMISLAPKVIPSLTGEPPYEGCGQAPDGRNFCARISTSRSREICVFEKTGDLYNYKGCVLRTGYMPMPTVTDQGSTSENPEIRVELANQAVNLQPRPDVSNPPNCSYLHQIEFCAVQNCLDTIPPPTGDQSTATACANPDSKVCVTGYDGDMGAVVNKSNGAVVAGKPNVKENNVWVFDPKQTCKQVNATATKPYCENYSGTCCDPKTCSASLMPFNDDKGNCIQYIKEIASAADDPYFVDSDIQVVRALLPEELGLCVDIPVSNTTFVRTIPGTYTYYPTRGCKAVDVELRGGGAAAGHGGAGDKWMDVTGGGAGYLSAKIILNTETPSEPINITLGSGGRTEHEDGQDSTLIYKYSSSNRVVLYSGGGRGEKSWGATSLRNMITDPEGFASNGSGGSAGFMSFFGGTIKSDKVTNLIVGNGGNAQNSRGGAKSGGMSGMFMQANTWSVQPSSECASGGLVSNSHNGGGGCANDDAAYGKGGHGKVVIKCDTNYGQ